MKKTLCYFTLLGLLFVAFTHADAATLEVPGTYLTIQAAINASSDGDVVSVGPAEYEENINFLGKAITVEGTHGPGLTTISGTAPVTFTTGEGPNSILDGFTITGGTQPGIYINDASPTIRNNEITGNSSTGHGGGIMAINSSAVIKNNTISENSSANSGGGIYIFNGSPLIEVNTFMSNEAGIGGGAMAMSGAAPTIMHNIIARNTAVGGSALYVQASSPVVVNNTFTKNTTSDNYGTIYLETSTSMTLMNSILYDNDGDDSPEIYESALVGVQQYSYSLIQGTYNHDYAGDGILDEEGVDPRFVNPDLDDYSLQSLSPCIDTGHPDTSDPDGSIADMGAIYSVSYGETGVCGDVGDQTWIKAGNPYIVTCHIDVPEGTTLTIEPGVEVRFEEGHDLAVHGTLHAVGTPEERIRFTSNEEEIYRRPDDWYGILLYYNATDSIIQYATIEYTTVGFMDYGYTFPPNRISHSIIRHSNTGVWANQGNTEIINNTLVNNEKGIFMVGAQAFIQNNIVAENENAGIWSFREDASSVLLYNDVWGNGASEVDNYVNITPGVDDIQEDPLLANSSIGDYRLRRGSPCVDGGDPDSPDDPDGTVADMGAILFYDAEYVLGDVGDQTWTAGDNPYIVVGDLTVPEGTTLTIEPGVEVRFDMELLDQVRFPFQLKVYGTLHAIGTPEDRILFTSSQDYPRPGDWEWIYVAPSASDTIIQYATIEYAVFGLFDKSMHSPPTRISHSIIHRNSHLGVYAYESNTEILNNTVVRNASSAMFLLASTALVQNNIVAKNAVYGISAHADVSASLLYNDVWENGSNYLNILPGEHDIEEDPLFEDLINGDYSLMSGSLCINGGDPDSPFDPDGTKADMGAIYFHQNIYPCFLPGTSILMADGALVAIEDIKPGDLVKSIDAEGNVVDSRVAKLFVHPDTDGYLLVETADGKQLRVTKEHPVLSDGEYKTIGTLTIDSPLTLVKDTELIETPIVSMRKVEGANTVFNFEVEDTHTYIAEGYAVHNKPITSMKRGVYR
ncbi:right-handed parallel beta-helix repeat-containing protein [Candidatus Omnitrophota bacterium]